MESSSKAATHVISVFESIQYQSTIPLSSSDVRANAAYHDAQNKDLLYPLDAADQSAVTGTPNGVLMDQICESSRKSVRTERSNGSRSSAIGLVGWIRNLAVGSEA
jgi:hypothetical protein